MIPFGGVLISKKTGIPISMGGALHGADVTQQEDKWSGPLPPHWSDSSRSKFYKSMSDPEDVSHECGEECEGSHEEEGAMEGPTKTCMKKIAGHVDDPGAFCASLRDRVTGTTHWRHGGKKS